MKLSEKIAALKEQLAELEAQEKTEFPAEVLKLLGDCEWSCQASFPESVELMSTDERLQQFNVGVRLDETAWFCNYGEYSTIVFDNWDVLLEFAKRHKLNVSTELERCSQEDIITNARAMLKTLDRIDQELKS